MASSSSSSSSSTSSSASLVDALELTCNPRRPVPRPDRHLPQPPPLVLVPRVHVREVPVQDRPNRHNGSARYHVHSHLGHHRSTSPLPHLDRARQEYYSRSDGGIGALEDLQEASRTYWDRKDVIEEVKMKMKDEKGKQQDRREPFSITISDGTVVQVDNSGSKQIQTATRYSRIKDLSRRIQKREEEKQKENKSKPYGTSERVFVHIQFVCYQKGTLVIDKAIISYTPNDHKHYERWLVDEMKASYYRTFATSRILPLREIGFAKYVRWQTNAKYDNTLNQRGPKTCWRMTTQEPMEPYKDSGSLTRFRYRLHHPFHHRDARGQTHKIWLDRLDRIIKDVGDDWKNCRVDIEIFEVPNTQTIMKLLGLSIAASVVAGVIYGLVTSDKSTAVSLASYLLACPALVLALYGAGEWIGLEKPDSFSWAYDIPSDAYAFEDHAKDSQEPVVPEKDRSIILKE